MSKWIIPRHRPKNDPDWVMEDKNHGRGFSRKSKSRRQQALKQRKLETAFLDLVTRQRDTFKAGKATIRIGQCSRKTKLSRDGAIKCCRSAAMETGLDMFGYECKWCGAYHITSHPLPGFNYPIAVKGFKPGETQWINRRK